MSAMMWVMIFYMSGYNAGGPGVAEFWSKEDCERAAIQIKASDIGRRLEGYVCVPKRS